MVKKVKIIDANDLNKYKNINEYLLHTYGENRLKKSKRHSYPTFLDVIGYTLDKDGFETAEGKYYELHEIEQMMSY